MDLQKVFAQLTPEEKQELMDELHADGVYPSRLIGSGTPAHVEAINANLNDLRGVVQLNAVTMGKFYEVISPRTIVPIQPEEIKKEPDLP